MDIRDRIVEFKRIPASDLLRNPKNWRLHPEGQENALRTVLQEIGFASACLVRELDDGQYELIDGHLRADLSGDELIPCLVLDVTEEEADILLATFDPVTSMAQADSELLQDLLVSIQTESEAMEDLLLEIASEHVTELPDDFVSEGLTDEDDVPSVPSEPVTQPGDMWILGRHRLLCGDSTSVDDVAFLCDGDPIDCCWSDPPYNVDYEGKSGQVHQNNVARIQNDKMSGTAFLQFLTDAFSAMLAVMRPGAPVYIAHADTEGLNFRAAFQSAGFKLSGCLVWVKPAMVLGRSDYQWRHEPILYGWRPGAAHTWYGGRNKTTVSETTDLPLVMNEDGSVSLEIGENIVRISGDNLEVEELVGSIFRAEKPHRSADHPTMKPVELILGMVLNSSRRGDKVLDPFGGSGSTLIACEKSGRDCRMLELDPRFCDVIVRRWEAFTGQQAERVNPAVTD